MDKSIIFDMDGVIFDTETVSLKAWRETAPKYNISDIDEIYPRCVGCNHRMIRGLFLEKYGADFPADDFLWEARRYFKQLNATYGVPVKAGVRELLEYLKNEGYKIALASSSERDLVVQELTDTDLLQYFDNLTCGDMVKKSKPDPQIFLTACEALGAVPEKTFVIEDSYNGVRAGFRGGFFTIMVPDMLPATDEMKEKSKLILPSLTDVKIWLEKNM